MKHPKKFPAARWARGQLIRETGLLEDLCKHGVGHPNLAWLKANDPKNRRRLDVHGCCGCCHESA